MARGYSEGGMINQILPLKKVKFYRPLIFSRREYTPKLIDRSVDDVTVILPW
jgi:hypothetical protein